MSRVIAAFAQFFDGAGDPLSNGWLRFLESGTNNSHKNTYADVDQSIPNANPLQLDGEGRCPNAFGQGIYKVISYANNPTTDLPGAMLQSFDPVIADYTPQVAGVNFSAWLDTETYQVGSIVLYNSVYYRSIVANNLNNPPDTNMDKWELIDFLRIWNADVTYAIDDLVIYEGALYFSFFDSNIGNQPDTSPAYWVEVGTGAADLSWKPDVIYSYGDVVESGTWFRSIQNNNINHDPSTSADWWESIDFIRYWNQYATYDLGDLVLRNSSFYTSLAGSNINHDPETSPAWWQITNISYVDSVFASVMGGFKNYFINGNLDIWQRGTSLTGLTSPQYLADRWTLNTSGATLNYSRQSFVVGQTDVPGNPKYFGRVQCTVADDNWGPEQRIENVSTFAGESVTISGWLKADVDTTCVYTMVQYFGSGGSAAVNTSTAIFAVTTTWQKYVQTITLPSISGKTIGTGDNLRMVIAVKPNATGILDFAQFQIEKGSVATEFERRPIGTELVLCQRYYEKSYPHGIYPGTIITSYAGVGFSARTGGTQPIPISFDTEKRTTPTFTAYSPATGVSGYIHRASDASDWLISNMINPTTHGIAGINLSAAITVGDMMFFHWTADAEL